MKLKLFLALLALPLAILGQNNKYNVLFIAVDDLRPELGAYGAKYMDTPSLDKFASESVKFNKHYVQVPTCGCSRFCMITGRDPFVVKMPVNNRVISESPLALSRELGDAAQSMPELFKRSGYKTALVGKFSHSPDGAKTDYGDIYKNVEEPELPNAWDEIGKFYTKWGSGYGAFFGYAGGKINKGKKPLFEFVAKSDDELPDYYVAEEAIKLLRKYKDDRFFIVAGFIKPHMPFVATKGDWDYFEDKEIPMPKHLLDRTTKSIWTRAEELKQYEFPFDIPVDAVHAKDVKRAYFACVRFVDRQIGKVLSEVEKLDLMKNTIVIVWGDHGWNLGEQMVFGKHTVLEESLRSPLIMKVPGNKSFATDMIAQSIDIFPTLIDLCNPKFTKTKYPLDGKSLVPVLKSNKKVNNAAFSYWGAQRAGSVRTDDYRMIIARAPKGTITELFDLRNSFETDEDVAAKNPEIVESHRKLLAPKMKLLTEK